MPAIALPAAGLWRQRGEATPCPAAECRHSCGVQATHPAPRPFTILTLPTPAPALPAEWMEAQGEDPAQLTYAELMVRASEGGNWKRALELFEGGRGGAGCRVLVPP